jgi:hypothetical protein
MCSKKNIILKREILEKIYLTFIRPLLEYVGQLFTDGQ